MVRETRYLWVGNLPDKVSDGEISDHFQSYGKIQSVKFIEDENGKAAIVAFMDIKSASKAHTSKNEIGGNVVHTEYSEASGGGVKITRPTGSTPRGLPGTPGTRYEGSKPGYGGDDSRSSYSGYSDYGGRRDGSGERWQGQPGSGGGGYYGSGSAGPERGRPRQRYQGQGYYQQGSRGGAGPYEGQYGQQYGGRQKPGMNTQSPAQSEGSGVTPSSQRQKRYARGSRSPRSSSSGGSSGSRSTSTSLSKRNKSGRSVVVQPGRKEEMGMSMGGGGKVSADHLGLLLRGLPARSSNTSLRDGLFHEYKKFGKVMSVSIKGEKESRFAIVTFKKHEDARKALEAAREKAFFGKKVQAEPHEGIRDSESGDVFRPPEADLDEYHHKATRTLFVGNLTKDSSKEELKAVFRRYGIILDIDIKNQQPNQVFAFVQFDNIKSVVRALHEMDGENIGSCKVKLGFGRSMPTNVLWVDNISEQIQESYLKRQFSRNGPANYVLIDRETCRALVFYDSNELAMQSLSTMRGRIIANVKIQIDFASVQCMNALLDNMEATEQLRPEDRPDQKGFRQYHQEQAPYESDKNWYQGGYGGAGAGSGGGGGRGKVPRSGGFYRPGGRQSQYYEPGYEEPAYNQKAKRYESGYEENDQPEGTYERSERGYSGYSQKGGDRNDSRNASPSHSRSEKHESHGTDDYRSSKDVDNDRETPRAAHRRDKYAEDRYDEKKKSRGYSPSNSEVSFRSSQRHRSSSGSPVPSRQSSRDKRAYSPSSPSRDEYSSRHSTPDSHSPRKSVKDLKSKGRDRDLPKSYQLDDDFKPSTSLMSEIQKTRPRKHSLKRESETDLTDLDKALQKRDLFGSPPLKRQAMEEEVEKSCREHDAEYRRKLAYEETPHRRTPGSHSLDYSGANVQDTRYRDSRAAAGVPYDVVRTATGQYPPGHEPEIESKFSTPSPSTKSTRSESDKTPDSTERHSGSHSSGDISLLEREKQRLLNELQEMNSNSSVSDGEIQDDEEKQKRKKPRIEDVFDDWSPSEAGMKQWREQAKTLNSESQQLQEQGWENNRTLPKNSRTEPPPKPPELESDSPPPETDGAKFKPIDAKKSYRKQMEAMRKEQEAANSNDSRSATEQKDADSDMDMQDDYPKDTKKKKVPTATLR